MLLRIEDTDRERSTEPAIAAILDGLKWLGLIGTATLSTSSAGGAPPRGRRNPAGHRQGLSLLRHAGRAHDDAGKGPRRGPHPAL